MSIRQRILIAIASGCVNMRQVAKRLGLPLSTVANYFYDCNNGPAKDRFVNGDPLQWTPGKTNTLHLVDTHNIAIVRDRGRVVAVGKAERVERESNY